MNHLHTFLLPSSSSSSRTPLPSSPRMGLCSGEGVWPGRLRVDIWKEGERQRGPLGLRGESWGLSAESVEREREEKSSIKERNKWAETAECVSHNRHSDEALCHTGL